MRSFGHGASGFVHNCGRQGPEIFHIHKCWLVLYLLICWKAHSLRTKRHLRHCSGFPTERGCCTWCLSGNKLVCAITERWLTNLQLCSSSGTRKWISSCTFILFCTLVSRFQNTVFFCSGCFFWCRCFMLKRALQIFKYICNGCQCPFFSSFHTWSWC